MMNQGYCGPHFHHDAAAAVEEGGGDDEAGTLTPEQCSDLGVRALPALGDENCGDNHKQRILAKQGPPDQQWEKA